MISIIPLSVSWRREYTDDNSCSLGAFWINSDDLSIFKSLQFSLEINSALYIFDFLLNAGQSCKKTKKQTKKASHYIYKLERSFSFTETELDSYFFLVFWALSILYFLNDSFDIEYVWPRNHSFKLPNSVSFSVFTDVYNHIPINFRTYSSPQRKTNFNHFRS